MLKDRGNVRFDKVEVETYDAMTTADQRRPATQRSSVAPQFLDPHPKPECQVDQRRLDDEVAAP